MDPDGGMEGEWKRNGCSHNYSPVCESLFGIIKETFNREIGEDMLYSIVAKETLKSKFF